MSDEPMAVTFGVCAGCNVPIKYSPVRMPVSPPVPNPDKPMHYGIEYVTMCIPCAVSATEEMRAEVAAGNLSPKTVWSQSPDGTLHIVSIPNPSPVIEEREQKDQKPKAGFLSRLLKKVW